MTSARPRKWLAGTVLLGLAIALAHLLGSPAQKKTPDPGWRQYAQPADAGFSADKLKEAWKAADAMGSSAVVVLFKGQVIAAWGDIARRIELHSARKSLMSALVGIEVGEGRLDLAKTMKELGIDDIPPLSEEEKTATLRDLVMSRSGIYHPAAKETADIKKSRPVRGSHKPGSFWWYNNWDFNMAGVIVERVTGKKVADEFARLIAEPVGMEDFRPRDVFEQYERSLSIHPAHAFRMSARDLARFGQLYLQGGEWQGRTVVPASWVEERTQPKSDVRPGTAYGEMWWVYPKGDFGRDNFYQTLDLYDKFAAIGSGGQLILVVPGAGFVFVHLVDTDQVGGVPGKKIWELAEMTLRAKVSDPRPDVEAAPLTPIPFSKTLPPVRDRDEIRLDPRVLEKYAGDYELGPKRTLSLRLYGDRLAGSLEGQEVDFFPESETEFFAKAADVQIVFARDDKGEVTGLVLRFMGKDQIAKRIRS